MSLAAFLDTTPMLGARGERAARHQDDPAAEFLDCRALLLVGLEDFFYRMRFSLRKMVGARTRRNDRTGKVLCFLKGFPYSSNYHFAVLII